MGIIGTVYSSVSTVEIVITGTIYSSVIMVEVVFTGIIFNHVPKAKVDIAGTIYVNVLGALEWYTFLWSPGVSYSDSIIHMKYFRGE